MIPVQMLLTGKVERIKLGSVMISEIIAIIGNDNCQAIGCQEYFQVFWGLNVQRKQASKVCYIPNLDWEDKDMIIPLQLSVYNYMITCLKDNLTIKNMSFCGPGVEWEAIFWIIGIL